MLVMINNIVVAVVVAVVVVAAASPSETSLLTLTFTLHRVILYAAAFVSTHRQTIME
jgi:hypothetical protein